MGDLLRTPRLHRGASSTRWTPTPPPGRRRVRRSIDVPEQLDHEAPYELVRRLRASIAVLGPLVARCHRASVALPGGDAIGSRGLDMHIAGCATSGPSSASSTARSSPRCQDRLRGANLWLDFPSVGATENLVMAAVLARGHHRDRQRRARAGDRRPVPDARRDGRPDRGRLDLDPDHRGRRAAAPDRARDRDRPHRRRHLGLRQRDRGRRGPHRGRRRPPPRHRPGQAGRPPAPRSTSTTTASRCSPSGG